MSFGGGGKWCVMHYDLRNLEGCFDPQKTLTHKSRHLEVAV